jgi:hypothetical protein
MIGIPVQLNVEELKPELDAQLVAEGVAQQLKRIMYRRAMKRAVTNTMRLGAEGIKLMGGRLNGAEIAEANGTERAGSFAYLESDVIMQLQSTLPMELLASRCGYSKAKYSTWMHILRLLILNPRNS